MNYFLLLILFSFSALNSQNTTVRLGAWQNSGKNGYLERDARDQLYDGFPDGIPRFSFLGESSQTNFFPLGFSHQIPGKSFSWIFRWNYLHRSLNQNDYAIDSNRIVTESGFKSGYSSDMETDFGIRKGIFSEKLFLVARLGIRNYSSEFSKSETTLSSNTILTTASDKFSAWNAQVYPALELEWKLYSLLYPWVEVFLPSNLNSGKFQSDSTRQGSYLGRAYWERAELNNDWNRDLVRGSIGGVIPILESLQIRFGYREERVTTFSRDVSSTPWRIASGGTFQNFNAEPNLQFSVLELLSDSFIYQQKLTTVQRGLFMGIDYKF